MRFGARVAQAEGYTLDKGLKARFQDGLGAPRGSRINTDEIRGKELVARAVADDPTEETLWRGITLDKETFSDTVGQAKVGDTLSMPLSSFDRNRYTAERFADTDPYRPVWVSRDAAIGPDARGVIYELEPGAKVAQVFGEQVAFGKFEVVQRLPVTAEGATHLVIRQTSMIEDGVRGGAAKARKAKGEKIPEVTLIKKPVVDDQGFENIGGTKVRFAGVDERAHQGIRDGLNDFHAKHPDVKISSVTMTDDFINPNMMAKAIPYPGDPDEHGWRTAVQLNEKYFREGAYEAFEKEVFAGAKDGWSVPIPDGVSAAHSVILHECGHGLDAAGMEQTRREVHDILAGEFAKLHPELVINPREMYEAASQSGGSAWIPDGDGGKMKLDYREWLSENKEIRDARNRYSTQYRDFLRENMSQYSFENGDSAGPFATVRPGEALAEASADVDMNGDKATVTSKALQARMVENAKPPTDTYRITSKPSGGEAKTPAKNSDEKEKARADKEAERLRKAAERKEKSDRIAAEKAAKAVERERKRDESNLKNYGTTDREVVAKIKAEAAKLQAEKDALNAEIKEKGFGSVLKRIRNGTTIEPVLQANGRIDLAATFEKYSKGEGRETLKNNWRQALRSLHPWSMEAGKVWYPQLNKLCVRLADMYGETFKANFGKELTPDLVATFMATFSENNVWANNLVGVRKFLDGTGGMPQRRNLIGMHVDQIMRGDYEKYSLDRYTFEDRKIKVKWIDYDPANGGTFSVKKEAYRWVTNDGKNYDLHVDKSLRAIKNPRGGLADLRENASGAPKPADFAANASGDYSRGTADRWVSRIMLHTDDYKMADSLWSYEVTKDGEKDRQFYKLFSKILEEVAPEFGLDTAAAQAAPWIEVVGPLGSIAYVEDLSSISAVNKETIRRAVAFGKVE